MRWETVQLQVACTVHASLLITQRIGLQCAEIPNGAECTGKAVRSSKIQNVNPPTMRKICRLGHMYAKIHFHILYEVPMNYMMTLHGRSCYSTLNLTRK